VYAKLTWVTTSVTQNERCSKGEKVRADRLLAIVLLLQARGKMTTQTLADELKSRGEPSCVT
jgi:hypothetical protein